jgi:hypothetical protein
MALRNTMSVDTIEYRTGWHLIEICSHNGDLGLRSCDTSLLCGTAQASIVNSPQFEWTTKTYVKFEPDVERFLYSNRRIRYCSIVLPLTLLAACLLLSKPRPAKPKN